MLLLTGAILGALIGRLAGGSLWNLANLRFRWPLLVAAALIVKELALFTPLSTVAAAAFVYVLSLWILLAWTLWHRDVLRGIWVVSVGMAANLLVIGANFGHMPISADLVRRAPAAMADRLLRNHVLGQYVVAGHDTHLNFLGDVITLPGWVGRIYPQAYSIGDLVALAGVFTVTLLAVCPHLLQNRRLLPVDVERLPDRVVVTAAVPGFRPQEVNVEAGERVLTITARRTEVATREAADTQVRSERYRGDLIRSVRLPVRVEPEQAVAAVRDGILTVSLRAHARPATRPVPVVEGPVEIPAVAAQLAEEEWPAQAGPDSRPEEPAAVAVPEDWETLEAAEHTKIRVVDSEPSLTSAERVRVDALPVSPKPLRMGKVFRPRR